MSVGYSIPPASLAVAGTTVLVAATPRALDDVSLFLPGSRVFLAVPYAALLLGAPLVPGQVYLGAARALDDGVRRSLRIPGTGPAGGNRWGIACRTAPRS